MADSAPLSPAAGHAFALRWYDRVWNSGEEKAIDEMVDPALEVFGFPDARSVTNAEGFKAAFRGFRAAFSDINVRVIQTITEGDRVCAHWSATMKHTGAGLNFAATNESVSFAGVSIVQLKNDRIVRGWNFFDLTREIARLKELAAARHD